MQVSRDVLYEDLQKLMLKEMAAAVKPDVLSSAQEVSESDVNGAGWMGCEQRAKGGGGRLGLVMMLMGMAAAVKPDVPNQRRR